jgi:alanyl-tRNA synthetase
MLGNFSFGDYFKEDAIKFAWEFLTDVIKLPAEKLSVTVYETDDEAYNVWANDVGVPKERIIRIGDKPAGGSDNFWQMGDTGPCGPSTEIFYDHGEKIAGGPPGSPDEDGDRFIEIWNLVFMQYDRDDSGKLNPLPAPSVDTGMGLERLAAVLQHVHNNYDIDLFKNLIKAVAKIVGTDDYTQSSLRVIADHIRACAFLVVDGVIPSNEGRGYVLRRIVRRAIRHGYKLGIKDVFFWKLVGPLCEEMGAAYPELSKAREQVERVLRTEEERFAETLEQGMGLLEEAIAGLKGKVIPGETVFRLYDTYGFPMDLTADVARERNLSVDEAGFEKEMDAQRDRARSASQFKSDSTGELEIEGSTEFTGYDRLEDAGKVLGLYLGGEAVETLEAANEAAIVLEQTPFYAESGGQVGDHGVLHTASGAEFVVHDTQKQSGAFIHVGELKHGSIKKGDKVDACVDASVRQATALNHSATHLLHAALRTVLGDHVAQKGSLVDADRLRFDFSHFEAVTPEQLREIETMVNDHIRANHEVETKLMNIDDARNSGAMALFGEKYDAEVRVLSMSEFSVELCGGTHVKRTGDIGLFKITSETGTAAGVRRIEGVTGSRAVTLVEDNEATIGRLAAVLKGKRDDVEERVSQLLERQKKLEKELEQLKGKLASSAGSDLASQATDIDGIKVLAARLDGADSKSLRDTLDQLKNKLGTAAIVLATTEADKVSIVAGVTKDATDRIKAGDLVNSVAQPCGGKGGGRPDMAQAGAKNASALDAALAAVPDWVSSQIGE